MNSCSLIATNYVNSTTVDNNGVITVLADESSISALTAATNTLTLAPIQTDSDKLVGINDGGKTIAGWRCGSSIDGTIIPAKYLPGSCRGNY